MSQYNHNYDHHHSVDEDDDETDLDQIARDVSIDMAIVRSKTLFRRPKGALIRRRSMRVNRTRWLIEKIAVTTITSLRKHKHVTIVLLAALITYLWSSSSNQYDVILLWKKSNPMLVQQLAKEACEQFTI